MNKTPLVSIIIPCFNCSKTIKRCLNSVVNQTYKNIEIIVVNDGSKDNTLSILKSFQSKDSRIVLINKTNTGVSESRNIGIKEAMGEYITFVDSDDYLDLKAIQKYINVINEYDVDLIISDFYRVLKNKKYHKGRIKNKMVFDAKEYGEYMLNNPADFYYGVLWNKLYKKSIIDKYKVNMPVKISWAEDFVFNLKYLKHVKSIYSINTPLYYYTKSDTSLTANSISISNIVKMKTQVYKYYNDFYKKVLTPAAYKKIKTKIYKFIIDGASDDGVNHHEEFIADRALNFNNHLTRKYLHDYFYDLLLEDLALKENLKLNDLYIFSLLEYKKLKVKDINVITGLSISEINSSLAKFKSKKYLSYKTNTVKKDVYIKVNYLKKGKELKKKLELLDDNYEKVITKGISKKELEDYSKLQNKINMNIINELKGE